MALAVHRGQSHSCEPILYACPRFRKLLSTLDFGPELIVERQSISHIVNAMPFFNVFSRSICDGRVHICVIDFRLICLGIIKCSLIWISIREVAQHHPEYIALHSVIQPGIRSICMRSVFWHRPIILPENRAFGGVNILDRRIFLLSKKSFTSPGHSKINITRNKSSLWAVAVKQLDAWNKLLEFGLGFIKLSWVLGIHVITQS